MSVVFSFFLSFFILITGANTFSAATPHTKASLIALSNPSKGGSFWVALVLEPEANQSLYWENPGDAGLEATFEWTLDDGLKAGPILWSTPSILRSEHSTSYGYTGKTYYFTEIHVPENYDKNFIQLTLKAKWLVCSNLCVPEKTTLSLNLPLSKEPRSKEIPDLIKQKTPHKITEILTYTQHQKMLTIIVPKALIFENPKDEINPIQKINFLPRQDLWVDDHAPQTFEMDDNHFYIQVPLRNEKDIATTSGLLIFDMKNGIKAFDITLTHTINPLIQNILMLACAFLGGIILNAMPCVFPVLSLKILSLIQHENSSKKREGVAYTLGIVASFLCLGGVMIALKHTGTAIGWGFQMQSPPFILFMIGLLFLIALNLSGFFHISWTGGKVSEKLSKKLETSHAFLSPFLTGILATLVATPCTAPFMATAIGYAFTKNAWMILLTMMFLGLGLAFPFLCLSFLPIKKNRLPKPGPWMIQLKEFLAFPLYLTLVWLIWILIHEVGPSGIFYSGWTLVALAFALWILKNNVGRKNLFTKITMFSSALSIALPFWILVSDNTKNESCYHDSLYSKEKLDRAIALKEPTLVYATAAWCLTCQMNEHVLASKNAQDLFKAHGVHVLKADWTHANPEITALLESFDRKGIPFCVFYPKEGEPVVLPEILTLKRLQEIIPST